MADQEIQILIKAIDETTKTLENIEGQMMNLNQSIQKQTKKTSDVFDKQMGSLIVLGQAAGRVESIQSSYVNLQLRLENAGEKLANAQDRLRNAQYKLTKVQKDTSSSAEDLANAQQEVESASRGLTISQNNLARAHNQVLGTYINIGVQTLSLIRSMPLLIAEVRNLTIASAAFIATPIGAALMAVGLVVGGVTLAYNHYNNELKAVETANASFVDSQQAVIASFKDANDMTNNYNQALQETYDLLTGFLAPQSEKEAQALYDIAAAKDTAAQAYLNGDYGIQESATNRAKYLQRQYDAEFGSARDLFNAKKELENAASLATTTEGKKINDFWTLSRDAQIKELETIWAVNYKRVVDESYANEIAQLDALIKKMDQAAQARARANSQSGKGSNAFMGMIDDFVIGIKTGKPASMSKYNDFISRPNGQIASFSSDDTIIGVKNPGSLGGNSITITGNIYGTDPKEMADAIMVQLRRKIAI